MASEASVNLPLFGHVQAKYVALVLLVGQTVGAIIMMRVSRLTDGSDGFRYLNTTAVFMSELLKLICSLLLVCRDVDYSPTKTWNQINATIIKKPLETFKVGIPAFLYTVQNNLIFLALTNMSPALYQVTYQLKILSTALLSVIILQRSLSYSKWLSLTILTIGVAFIQIPTGGKSSSEPSEGNFIVGVIAVLCACMTSGFAGVYFEKILKGSTVSIWMRNIQLAIFGSLIALIGAFWYDSQAINSNGFFQGYTIYTWSVILLQSAGGLIVAAVLKYADNILKCFGNAMAIVLSCLVSYFLLNDFDISIFFIFGTVLVVFATYAYGVDLDIMRSLKGKFGYNEIIPKLMNNHTNDNTRFDEDKTKTTEMISSSALLMESKV